MTFYRAAAAQSHLPAMVYMGSGEAQLARNVSTTFDDVTGKVVKKRQENMTVDDSAQVKEHLMESVRWYKKAAGMGSDVAQYELGVMHLPNSMHSGGSEVGAGRGDELTAGPFASTYVTREDESESDAKDIIHRANVTKAAFLFRLAAGQGRHVSAMYNL